MDQITITKNAARNLRNFFCWVYQNEMIAPDDICDGSIIEILASNGYLAFSVEIACSQELAVRG